MSEQPDEAKPAAWVMLALLFVAYNFSLMDRTALALLVQPIKAAMGLTDTQLSLLQGLAFVLLYCSMAIPIGRLVDRRSRVRILAVGMAFWSIMTAVCGLSSRYWQLFLARAGVGIGEATLSPAAYSLIADSFPARRLGLALGIFTLGAATGTALMLIGGGIVVDWIQTHGIINLPILGPLAPWKVTFFVLGLPGLIVARLIALLSEPQRRHAVASIPNWRDVRQFVQTNIAWMAPHHAAVGLSNIVLFGTTSWIIAFFARAHGWGVKHAGAAAGIASLVGSIIGLLGGGQLSDFARRRGIHARLYVCATATAISAVFCVAFPLVQDPRLAAALWGVAMAAAVVPIGVSSANLQEMTAGRMRGIVSAFYIFTITIIGTALGPTLIAATSDRFFHSADGLRYALALVASAATLCATGLFILAARRQALAIENNGSSPRVLLPAAERTA
jgi:MFS family permease